MASTTLTPFAINTLLHVYTTPVPFLANTPALKDALSLLEAEMMIVSSATPCGYRITLKGEHHIRALCCLPFPEPRWITPGTTYMDDKRGEA